MTHPGEHVPEESRRVFDFEVPDVPDVPPTIRSAVTELLSLLRELPDAETLATLSQDAQDNLTQRAEATKFLLAELLKQNAEVSDDLLYPTQAEAMGDLIATHQALVSPENPYSLPIEETQLEETRPPIAGILNRITGTMKPPEM